MYYWTLLHVLDMSLIYFGSPAKPLLQAEPQPSPKNLIFMMVTPSLLPLGSPGGLHRKRMGTIYFHSPFKPCFLVICIYSVWDIGSYQGGTALGSVPKVVVTFAQRMST